MKKNQDKNIISLIQQFQKTVLQNKPHLKKMTEEVRMMRFKIKPLQGDLLTFNFYNVKFIELLWSLGKLDEFYQGMFGKLSTDDRKLFYSYVQSIHHNLQEELHRISLKPEQRLKQSSQILEVEIFKDTSLRDKKKVN